MLYTHVLARVYMHMLVHNRKICAQGPLVVEKSLNCPELSQVNFEWSDLGIFTDKNIPKMVYLGKLRN